MLIKSNNKRQSWKTRATRRSVGSVGVRERSSKEAAHFYEFYLLNDILFNFVDGPPPIFSRSFLIPHSRPRRRFRAHSRNFNERRRGERKREKKRKEGRIKSSLKNLLISYLKLSESAGKKKNNRNCRNYFGPSPFFPRNCPRIVQNLCKTCDESIDYYFSNIEPRSVASKGEILSSIARRFIRGSVATVWKRDAFADACRRRAHASVFFNPAR